MDAQAPKLGYVDKLKKLAVVAICAIGGLLLLVICFGCLFGYYYLKVNRFSDFGNKTQSEIINKSALFLVSLVGNSKKGVIVPMLISVDNSENAKNAGTWVSNGKKMGIQGTYSNGVFGLYADPEVLPTIKSISFVSGPESGVIPGIPALDTKTMYNYIIESTVDNRVLILYGPNGPSDWLRTLKVVEEPPKKYEDLKGIALQSIQESGYCPLDCASSQPPASLPSGF